MAQREILQLVERATDDLPEIFRIVFMTRAIEGMSTEDTAKLLGLQPDTVKTRLHRRGGSCAMSWTSKSAPCSWTRFRSLAGVARA